MFNSIQELAKFVDNTKKTSLSKPIPVRESDARLDIESRAHDNVRLVKHVHQNCATAGLELRLANILKLIHAVDGYMYGKQNGNPVSMLCNARYIVELAAFMTHLEVELAKEKANLAGGLTERAKRYYQIIQRAKLGARFREVKEFIKSKVDLSNRDLEPFPIGTCLNTLSRISSFERCYEDDYSFLSDVVHHSGLSHATVSEKIVAAYNTNRGYFDGFNLSPTPFTSTVYQWPLQEGVELLSRKVDPLVLKYASRAVDANNALEPVTPFSKAELLEWTGTELGLDIKFGEVIEVQFAVRQTGKQGRNALCSCGSGKKYRNCCLLRDRH